MRESASDVATAGTDDNHNLRAMVDAAGALHYAYHDHQAMVPVAVSGLVAAVAAGGVSANLAGWIPFTERMPPARSGYLLVTNNVDARNAYGKSSRVWLVSMVHTQEDGPEIFNGKTLAQKGEITAFTEFRMYPLRGLTHWRYALPEEAEP